MHDHDSMSWCHVSLLSWKVNLIMIHKGKSLSSHQNWRVVIFVTKSIWKKSCYVQYTTDRRGVQVGHQKDRYCTVHYNNTVHTLYWTVQTAAVVHYNPTEGAERRKRKAGLASKFTHQLAQQYLSWLQWSKTPISLNQRLSTKTKNVPSSLLTVGT